MLCRASDIDPPTPPAPAPLLLQLLLLLKGGAAVELLRVRHSSACDGHTSRSHAGQDWRANLGPGSTGMGLSMLLLLPWERFPAEPTSLGCWAVCAAAGSSEELGCVLLDLLPVSRAKNGWLLD